MPVIDCPKCRHRFDVPHERFGQLVDCPVCDAQFPAIDGADSVSDGEPAEFLNPDRFEPKEQRAWVYERAHEAVRRPAGALFILGIFGLALSILGGLLFGVAGIYQIVSNFRILSASRPNPGPGYLAIASVLLLSIPFHVFIFVGASRLRKLRSLGWGYCSATLALLSFLLFGPFAIISIPYAIYGILALIALSKWEVRQAIRWKR